jgi:hypothetical protein
MTLQINQQQEGMSAVPVLRTKEVKIRVHYLSLYTIKLQYLDSRQYSFVVTLTIKNYTSNPCCDSNSFEMNFMTQVDKIQAVDSFEALGRYAKSIKPLKEKSFFYDKFNKLEYYTDGLIKINSDIKRMRKIPPVPSTTGVTTDDKIEKRRKIKELKKSKCSIQSNAIREIKSVMAL